MEAAVPANHLYISAGTLDLTSQKTGRKKKVHARLFKYEGWNFNSGNYLFTTDTK